GYEALDIVRSPFLLPSSADSSSVLVVWIGHSSKPSAGSCQGPGKGSRRGAIWPPAERLEVAIPLVYGWAPKMPALPNRACVLRALGRQRASGGRSSAGASGKLPTSPTSPRPWLAPAASPRQASGSTSARRSRQRVIASMSRDPPARRRADPRRERR